MRPRRLGRKRTEGPDALRIFVRFMPLAKAIGWSDAMESDYSKLRREPVEAASGDKQRSSLGARIASPFRDPDALMPLHDAAPKKPLGFDKLGLPRLRAFNYTIPDLSTHLAGKTTDWQQLIILGNGFDLQCGLRSQFSDFFGPRLKTIASIPDFKRETWSELVANSELTLWDFILEGNIGTLWCDVEGTVERWVLSAGESDSAQPSPFNEAVERIKLCPFEGDSLVSANGHKGRAQGDQDRMYGDIARYVWTLHPEIADEGYSRESFMALLRHELVKLEYAFGDFLSDEVTTNEGYADKCAALYKAIEQDGIKTGKDYRTSTSVLSFNYTNQVEKSFDGGEDGACVNIHGELGGEIIFGIDGKDCMDNPDAVSFTKTFRLMRRGGSRTYRLIHTANSANLEHATDVIKFYGHSLGKADYSYFQSIFDGVDLYESKTVLVFYYPFDSTDEAEEKSAEWRNELANSINDLLVAYGATMDNSDHGKNLMHKLLLEGRLILRGIEIE